MPARSPCDRTRHGLGGQMLPRAGVRGFLAVSAPRHPWRPRCSVARQQSLLAAAAVRSESAVAHLWAGCVPQRIQR